MSLGLPISPVFIMGSGGIKEPFAVIKVSYPQGSSCSCSDGNRILRAKDTSGEFIFLIPSEGTWTVSCTDGTKTASKVVAIYDKYYSFSISLAYQKYIIQNGNILFPTVLNYVTAIKENDYLIVQQAGVDHCYFNTGKIDITQYSNLYFQTKAGKPEVIYFGSAFQGCGFGISDVALASVSYDAGTRLSSGYSGKTLTCDISSYTGNYYASCDFEGSREATQALYITNMWLE